MKDKNKMAKVERDRGKPIADVLIEEFEQHGSQVKVAEALGVSQSTISYWLLKAGLTTRVTVHRSSVNGGAA